jgi:N-acetylglucosamine kinase-like BadF-type ATPase
VEKAVFALAGIDTSTDEKVVEGVVQSVINTLSIEVGRLRVENDCLSALLGATQHKAGILLIAGTGSIVFAHDGNNRIVRSGGWGHRVGDEGSGYWIGKQAIRSVLKMQDGRGMETILSRLLLNKFGFSKTEDLYNWTYSDSYSVEEIGALAPVVDTAYRLGDAVSKRILDEAVDELMLLLESAIKKADLLQGSFDLLLQGGVFHHNTYIKSQVLQRIQQYTTKVRILTSQEEPIRNIIKRGLKLI